MKLAKPQAVLAGLVQAVFPPHTPKSKAFVLAACEAVFNQCKCPLEEEHHRKLCEHEGTQMISPAWKPLKPAQLSIAMNCKTASLRFSDFSYRSYNKKLEWCCRTFQIM